MQEQGQLTITDKDCVHYFADSYTRFILTEIPTGESYKIDNNDYNHLILILKGRLLIEYNEFKDRNFAADEIVFIPAYANPTIVAQEDSRVLIGTFELWTDVYTSNAMSKLWELRKNMQYTFSSAPIKPQMKQFLDLLIMYLESGMQCARLHEVKEKEVFLVFLWYYTAEEIVKLFHPIIYKSMDFRALVIKNYESVDSIGELADLAGMSRTKFDTKFRDVFGVSAKQWILNRKAESIKYYLTKPDITISDIMIKYRFSSFTHFNRFCKQHFGAAPSELIKENQKK